MILAFTEHADTRMKQRGITLPEIEHVLTHPERVIKSFDDTYLATGVVQGRRINVKFARRENYICIITVM